MVYPESIQRAINAFASLPGVGPKTAERLIFFLLAQSPAIITEFIGSIGNLSKNIQRCQQCQNFSQEPRCVLCANPQRDQRQICVVAYPQDVYAIEKTNDFRGTYHVLGGTVDTLEGITPEQLHIRELYERLEKLEKAEVILALNPDLPGETTMLYLTNICKKLPSITITRLARGLPSNGDLGYADEVTLSSALKGRQKIN